MNASEHKDHKPEPGILVVGINLCIIGLVAGIILAVTNYFTEPIRKANEEKAKIEAQQKLLPEASLFEPITDSEGCFVGKDQKGGLVGYIISIKQKGFEGFIEMMVGVDSTFAVTDYKILKAKETPGLGAKAKEDFFRKQFKGRKVGNFEVSKVPDDKKIVALTGATITSRAVANGIQNGITQLEQKLEGGQGSEKKEGSNG